MKPALSTRLLALPCVALLACEPADYTANTHHAAEPFVLDLDTPQRSFMVTLCWEGRGEPHDAWMFHRAAAPQAPDGAVLMRLEGSEPLALSATPPSTDDPSDLRAESWWPQAEDACLTGTVVHFSLADLGEGAEPVTVEWAMDGYASSRVDEAVEDLLLDVFVEEL